MDRPSDIWLWDGRVEYEGVVAKYAEPTFTAHLRDTGAAKAALAHPAGRRVSTTFFDFQRQFVGRRFLAFCKLAGEPRLQEAEITSVQRSSAPGCDFFVAGRLYPVDDSRLEALQRLPGGVPPEALDAEA